MTTKRLTKAAARLAIALAVVTPSTVIAEEKWVVLRFGNVGGGATNGLADTFQDLLAGEIRRHVTPNADSLTATRCGTIACAARVGRASGARFALFGSLSKLGSKVIVQSTLVDVDTSAATASQKMSVSRVEDLDAAATRIALAYARGTTTDNTAELGLVTSGEMKPDKRREGARGIALKLGGVVANSASMYGPDAGLFLDVSYWFEASSFSIEPRLGLRFSPEGAFIAIPLELGANFLFSRGNVAPYVGLGAGFHFVHLKHGGDALTGGVSARAGLMLFRNYAMRMLVAAEYSVAFASLGNGTIPQSLTFGVGVIF